MKNLKKYKTAKECAVGFAIAAHNHVAKVVIDLEKLQGDNNPYDQIQGIKDEA